MTILVGSETLGGANKAPVSEKGHLTKRTAIATGKVATLKMKVPSSNKCTKWRLGLFKASAGKPSTFMAETGTITVATETALNVEGAITEQEVTSGEEYFLAFLPLETGGKISGTAKAAWAFESTVKVTELNKGVFTTEEETWGEPVPIWGDGTEEVASTGNPVTMLI